MIKIPFCATVLLIFSIPSAIIAQEVKDQPPITAFEEGSAAPRTTITGDWGGVRTKMHDRGVDVIAILTLDDTWNLAGGKHRTRAIGDYEYLFDLIIKADTCPLLHYPGGTLFLELQSHHGKSPTLDSVGSFNFVDIIEAPPFNSLYSLWYKQASEDGRFWILAGKSDAWVNFEHVDHSFYFFNAGYEGPPTILFFPTYPNPAMSVIGFATFPDDIVTLTMGVFDGSLAEGAQTGKLGVTGHFFNHLAGHAFIIGELGFNWTPTPYTGRLGVGVWKHTAEFEKFGGGNKKGTWGPYATLEQIVRKTETQEGAAFLIFGAANPTVSQAHRYYAGGTTWKGISKGRPDDVIGAGISCTNFSKQAGFSEACETSYEAFYVWQFAAWGYLQPDFQYIVHPGGNGLPNASVFTLRLEFNL